MIVVDLQNFKMDANASREMKFVATQVTRGTEQKILITHSSNTHKYAGKQNDLAIIIDNNSTASFNHQIASTVSIVNYDGQGSLVTIILQELMMMLRAPSYKHHSIWYKQLLPFYQPIYSIETGGIIGYEALARLKLHECAAGKSQVLLPLVLLKWLSATENVLVLETLLTKALEVISNESTTLFLNLDCSSLIDPLSFDLLKKVLKDFRELRPNIELALELTEGQLEKDLISSKSLDANIKLIRKLGVSFAVDDFGSDTANYDWLRIFRPHLKHVKIDKGHFWELYANSERDNSSELNGTDGNELNSSHDSKNLESLLHSINVGSIIIEGVENKSQLLLLQETSRALPSISLKAQGYFLGMPNESLASENERIQL